MIFDFYFVFISGILTISGIKKPHEAIATKKLLEISDDVPFCVFKVHPVASENQVNDMIKQLTG
ncbi:hypothetical protein JY97_09265 [Alkalispirochaeta odontotermitis]|nr:hypothetical protein JY97_09265 [Alkalispirochaeta odontotermitis]CAB1074964.1 hypothetical protein D1AOALGA4SA_2784 [Olavius algarvensis Delta 1 endosymbiont]